MRRYKYQVKGMKGYMWTVLAVGPRGGIRWIATYGSQAVAQKVADLLNGSDGK